jgi:alkylhydroperoxidase family enzyme
MPFRLNVPEGVEPALALNAHGTPMLVAARHAVYTLVYDAPETSINLREREVMRFPLTVVMGCPFCNSIRMWRDWPGYTGDPIPEDFYEAAARREYDWPGFTARERALLRFVEAFDSHIDTLNDDDALWDEMHSRFTETEIGDIAIMAGTWVGYGRCLKALGVGSVCEITPSSV